MYAAQEKPAVAGMGVAYTTLHERTRNLQDPDVRITAAPATLEDHPDRAVYLNNLSIDPAEKQDLDAAIKNASLADVEAAIDNANLAVAGTPNTHPDYARRVDNISIYLTSRYERVGNLQDLEAAITNSSTAVSATPDEHPDHAVRLNNLSIHLASHYERTGNFQDLEAVILYANRAVTATPESNSNCAGRLNILSSYLARRYERTRRLQDLEAAMDNASLAVASTPDDDPDRAGHLSNLSIHLTNRYKQTRSLQAMAATTEDHRPDHATCLYNLSSHLFSPFEQTGNLQDLETAITNANLAVATTPDDHPVRASYLNNFSMHLCSRNLQTGNLQDLAMALQHFLASANLPNAVPLYRIRSARGAIRMLQKLQQDWWQEAAVLAEEPCSFCLLHAVSQTEGLAADGCSMFLLLRQPEKALLILEFGRGLILGYLVDSRSDLVQQQRKVPRKLEKCINKIRQQEGYEQFLLELSIQDLMNQATEGPVAIISITDFGNHIIIVQDQNLCSLHLPEMRQTSRFALDDQIRHELGSFYTHYDDNSPHWLWSHCVKPVTRKLNLEGQVIENTMSRAISSYIPTIKALAYSRSQLAKLPPKNNPTSIYIAAMPPTPNEQPLPGVESEVNAIQQACSNIYTVILQRYPAPEAVSSAMEDTDIIHLACHGSSNPINPSDSHLLLHRSACSTAHVSACEFTDEAIHLAIGDATCAQVAGSFYSYLVKHQTGTPFNRLIAEALHTAVLEVRSHGGGDPSAWACFIHHGA
ncbi:CHAT domain-containing protein [Aspergillus foveolatus]|uniref:CHAT domain-containing protein n=1 Tax=Aspergillus foveolatus TaxID=210207 RepID=UPI003CCE0A43